MLRKPGVLQLAGDAARTTRSHFPALRVTALPFFGLVAATTLLEQLGLAYSLYFVALELVNIYLAACFALAWQKQLLLEFRHGERVNPLRLKRGERAFVAIIIGILAVCILGGTATALFVGKLCCVTLDPASHIAIAGVAGVLVFVTLAAALAPFQFALPAKSLNAPISLRQVRILSRGLVFRLILATTVTILPLMIAMAAVQLFIAPIIVFRLLGLSQQTLAGGLGIYLFANIPSMLISFLITALSIVVLTRLYQWSVQNRPLPATESRPA